MDSGCPAAGDPPAQPVPVQVLHHPRCPAGGFTSRPTRPAPLSARTRVEAAQAALRHDEGAAQPAGEGHRVQALQQRGLRVVLQVAQVALHLAQLHRGTGAG